MSNGKYQQGSNQDGSKTIHEQRRRLSVQNDPNIGKLVYEGVSEAAAILDARVESPSTCN